MLIRDNVKSHAQVILWWFGLGKVLLDPEIRSRVTIFSITKRSREDSVKKIFNPVTLPETNSKFAPEHRPKIPNRKGSYSKQGG